MIKDNKENITIINKEAIIKDVKDVVFELIKARAQIGWSIAELSRRANVSIGVISDLENGWQRGKIKIPSLANFIALARTLGISKECVLDAIFNIKMHDETYNNSTETILRNSIRNYGVHDEDSINFIIQSIDFIKGRKKNKNID